MMQLRKFDRQSVPLPRADAEFPNTPGDVYLEIGCGVGLHPIQWCQAHPNKALIAIEHTKTRYGKFSRRIARHEGLDNLVPVFDDAISWVSHRVPRHSLAGVFLLYPNPYPKESQSNKRWHRMPFMARIIDSLAPGGTLQLATNERFYRDEAQHWLQDYWKMELNSAKALSEPGAEGLGRTHFERKYLSRGEVCYDLVFRAPSEVP